MDQVKAIVFRSYHKIPKNRHTELGSSELL